MEECSQQGIFFHVHCSIKKNKQTILLCQKKCIITSQILEYMYMYNVLAMSWKQRPPKCCEWLAVFLTSWLSYWLIVWLIDWLTGWHVNQLTCLIPTYWSFDWLTGSILLTGCFTDKLIDWQSQTDLLIITAGTLTNWLDWLADILRFMLWKESRLLIVNQAYWLLMKKVNFSFQIGCVQQMS